MTSTSVSLLERLRQPDDRESWNRFVGLYTPLIFAWARQVGLQETDAADLVQDVFAQLLDRMPQFVHDRQGSFRAWLKTVTLNYWRTNCRRKASGPQGAGTNQDLTLNQLATQDVDAFWEAEYRQHLVGQALRIMRTDFDPKTWQACWAMVVEEQPAAKVAQKLGISVGTVYAAKCRVLARLRQELAGLME